MTWSLIHNLYTIEERPLIGLGHRLDTIRHAGASARHSSKRFAPRQTRGRGGPIVSIRVANKHDHDAEALKPAHVYDERRRGVAASRIRLFSTAIGSAWSFERASPRSVN